MALYFFPSLFFFSSSLTKYLVFNIFYVYVFYVQSTYRIYSKQYMSSVSFVPCGVLFYLLFIFNIFVTSESMYIVMMIEKKKKKLPHLKLLYNYLPLSGFLCMIFVNNFSILFYNYRELNDFYCYCHDPINSILRKTYGKCLQKLLSCICSNASYLR